MKYAKPLFLQILILLCATSLSVQAAAPAPMPTAPTINDVTSVETLTQYTKGLIEYLRTAPPYYDSKDDQKTTNLNEEYADNLQRWLSSSGESGVFRQKCENGRCITYAAINDRGYCLQNSPKMMLPTESNTPYAYKPLGPIEANRQFVLAVLSKMYNYAINHDWPRVNYLKGKTKEEKKEIFRKIMEFRIATGLVGPSETCNRDNLYAGCGFVVSPLVDNGSMFEIKPCV